MSTNGITLGKMAGKAEPFSWREVEYELVVKYLENLTIEIFSCNFEWWEIKHLLIFRLWVIIFAPRKTTPIIIYLFKVNNKRTKKECEISSKLTIKTQERLSIIFIVNFGHNSHFFQCFCCWLWTRECLLGPTQSVYKRWNNMLLQLLTDVQKS